MNQNNLAKHFQSTLQDGTMRSGFSEFERDLEDQLSEVGLSLNEMNVTINTHASQYTEQISEISALKNKRL